MARKALNYAIDRNTVIALDGGSLAAVATCRSYRPRCPVTSRTARTRSGLARAGRGARRSGAGRAARAGVGDAGRQGGGAVQRPRHAVPSLATARYVVSVLDVLGYPASLRPVDPNAYWNVFGDSRNRVQVGFYGWFQDYPAPSDFIDLPLTCGSFLSDNPGNVNTAEFCDPQVDAQARQALASQVGDPATAAGQWAAVDHEIVDQAPWIPLYNPRDLTVLSARTGNYQFHPYWNLLLDQLWIR